MDDLDNWRKEVDKIDDQLVELLSERFRVTNLIGDYKKLHGFGNADPAREEIVINSVVNSATENGLDPELMRELYPIILRYSKNAQQQD